MAGRTFLNAEVTFSQNVCSVRVGPEESQGESGEPGVSLEEAMTVFRDPLARIFDDEEHSKEEKREIIIGHSVQQRLVLVSFAGVEDRIRLLRVCHRITGPLWRERRGVGC